MNREVSTNWSIEQKEYEPAKEDFYESIFSLGNGYMGVRGFHEETCEKKSYEFGTYIAGIFDYFKPRITDIVNTPNYLYSRLMINNLNFNFKKGKLEDYRRVLNLKNGTLTRSLIWQDANNNRTKIESVRFLSIADIHNAVIRYKITPLNYSGNICFETAIDAQISNNPVNDDQLKNDFNPIVFLQDVEKNVSDEGICYITVITKESEYQITEAFSVDVSENGKQITVQEEISQQDRYISKKVSFDVRQGNEYMLDKMVAVYTSRDEVKTDIKNDTLSSVAAAKQLGFDGMYERNKRAWRNKWDVADIVIKGDNVSQLAMRYNIFQLIQSNAEDNPWVSIGARGLTHSRYKGCYFWDTEIYMLPFFMYTNPKAARNLLMYRYNTLSGAEANAVEQNVEGARYAWMCTIDGREQCDSWDIGLSEVHITADIPYAINQYREISGDDEFIKNYGAEIYIKTARYWRSRFSYHKEKDCYNMLFVKGPNEYGGVTQNNTFTTFMAIHNFNLAIEAIQLLEKKYSDKWIELKAKIRFDDLEMDIWKDIINKAVINYDDEKKLYIEDDNFLKMEPLDIHQVKTNDRAIYHKICFDRLQRYMVLKQADVILLMILLAEKFTDEEKQAAWNFYEPITLHDSTLSFGIHALFAARLGLMEKAYEYFSKSVRLDLDDIMCNTGKEGIHSAALGASWQAIVNGFGGVEIKNGELNINPNLPDIWEELMFKIIYRGLLINISISQSDICLSVDKECEYDMITVKVRGETITLIKGKEISIQTARDPQ